MIITQASKWASQSSCDIGIECCNGSANLVVAHCASPALHSQECLVESRCKSRGVSTYAMCHGTNSTMAVVNLKQCSISGKVTYKVNSPRPHYGETAGSPAFCSATLFPPAAPSVAFARARGVLFSVEDVEEVTYHKPSSGGMAKT